MSTAHTPGPWKWFNYPDGRKLLAGTVRAVLHCPDAPIACEPVDQHLIAAAPELLAGLRTVVAMYGPSSDYGDPAQAVWKQAEAAIAKAEGR
jgi:hypothetical protein